MIHKPDVCFENRGLVHLSAWLQEGKLGFSLKEFKYLFQKSVFSYYVEHIHRGMLPALPRSDHIFFWKTSPLLLYNNVRTFIWIQSLAFWRQRMYYCGKKCFNRVFSSYFIQLICVLTLIFVCLVNKKVKKFLWDIKKVACSSYNFFFL